MSARLAQCPRCHGFTLLGEVAGGIPVAVDVAPVDALGFGIAVTSGVELFAFEKGQEGASGRLTTLSGPPRPSWGPNGSQTGAQRLHAEHSCGALAKDMRVIQPKGGDKGPPSAPVTPGNSSGGPHPSDAPAGATGAQERPPRATPATHHPSRPRRCDICRHAIGIGDASAGIECGTYLWAVHEECP